MCCSLSTHNKQNLWPQCFVDTCAHLETPEARSICLGGCGQKKVPPPLPPHLPSSRDVPAIGARPAVSVVFRPRVAARGRSVDPAGPAGLRPAPGAPTNLTARHITTFIQACRCQRATRGLRTDTVTATLVLASIGCVV